MTLQTTCRLMDGDKKWEFDYEDLVKQAPANGQWSQQEAVRTSPVSGKRFRFVAYVRRTNDGKYLIEAPVVERLPETTVVDFVPGIVTY